MILPPEKEDSLPDEITIEPLAAHPEVLPVLREWFEAEWPSYYGPGGRADAMEDLQAYGNIDRLPIGLVALLKGELCGVIALKAESISSHRHLSPWAAAGVVHPSLRGRGIGARLMVAIEAQARAMGFERIYCGTSTSATLLQRRGWQLRETILHDGESLEIYSREL